MRKLKKLSTVRNSCCGNGAYIKNRVLPYIGLRSARRRRCSRLKRRATTNA